VADTFEQDNEGGVLQNVRIASIAEEPSVS
jgi:hypothetical protein